MIRTLALWLILLASIVSAQPLDYSTGGNLKRRQYQTYAAMTLYVDPTGSDSNACTSSGTGACLTVQGAVDKVPARIRHAVIINMAAGTYAGTVNVFSRTFTDAATFTLQGSAWADSTLATGTSTGTSTAYTAAVPSTATLGIFTDAAQTWTADDLKGRFLTITSGAASGQQRVIVSNTGTALNLNSTITGLAAGATYAIQEPAAIITGAVNFNGLNGFSTNNTPVVISDLTLSTATTTLTVSNTSVRMSTSTPGTFFLRRVRTLTSGGSVAFTCTGGSWCGITGTAYVAAPSTGQALYVTGGAMFTDSGGYYVAGAATIGTVIVYSGGNLNLGASNATTVMEATSGGFALTIGTISGTAMASVSAFSSVYRASTGACLAVTGRGTYNSFSQSAHGFTCTSSGGLGISLVSGASMLLSSTSVFSITSSTGDFSVDGTTYTSAFFNALSPKTILGTSGSLLHKD